MSEAGDTRDGLRDFILGLGADDAGFACVGDYRSPASPPIESLLPGARSLIALAFREFSAVDSPSPQMAMNGRLDVMEYSRSIGYRLTRHLEGDLHARALTVPVSYPMDFSDLAKSGIAELSLRHAAVAAGLGAFGQHNLVVHPRFGTRVIFAAIITDLEFPSDPQVEASPCTGCGLCVEACPAGALDEAGKTHLAKCMATSQPYGARGSIAFWSRFGAASTEGRNAMLRSPEYLGLYQAGFIGLQYFCFRCLAACPIGRG
jgi:epoxyqueuosine reductase